MKIEATFCPAPWCRNPHAQTIVAGLLRRPPEPDFERETIELSDGDFLDVSLTSAPLPPEAPVALVLAGINGGPDSPYVRGMVRSCDRSGIRSAVLHYRGLLRPNRLPVTFHSGRTEDLAEVVNFLTCRFPLAPRLAIGYSLGSNMLLKYLGECGAASGFDAAAVASVPFDLAACARTISQGFRRSYQSYLLRGLKAMARAKQAAGSLPIATPDWSRLTTFAAFDDAVTAPLNGFKSAADYYATASCARFLAAVRTPTLIVHARDDPFMTPSNIPESGALSGAIRLELAAYGGHVGFVAGDGWGRPEYWLERRIPAFLKTWSAHEAECDSAPASAVATGR